MAAALICAAALVGPAAEAGAQQAGAQQGEAQQDPRVALVDSVFAGMAGTDRPGAAVAVVQDGRVVLERGYGSAQLEYGVPITPSTVFHVASVSKQFTTFAVVLLAQEGRLSLDDDVRTHLPELHDFGHRITIRHLIHHTSGIRDQWELLMMAGWRLDDVITREHIMAMMRRQRELNFVPGSEHLYSNMGYSLLAEIVERASGRPFAAFLEERVFRPLGMNSTHVHNDHERIVTGRAYSYRPGPGGQGWRNAVLSYANQGATSLFTTAGDLARWLVNFETMHVGGAAAITQMRQRGVLNNGDTIPYAFAVSRSEHRGRVAWGHSGADAGFRSIIVHLPDERLAVVVLSNAANVNPGQLALAVLDVYLPPAAEDAQAAAAQAARQAQQTQQQQQTQPPAQTQQVQQQQQAAPAADALHALTGDFYSPELATVYTVLVRGDTLLATHPRLGESRLVPGGEADVFRGGNRVYRFVRDDAGHVTGLRLTGSRVRNIRFVKLDAGALPPF